MFSFLRPAKREHSYKPLSLSKESNEDPEYEEPTVCASPSPSLELLGLRSRRSTSIYTILPWVLSAILGIGWVVQSSIHYSSHRQAGTYETGFETELSMFSYSDTLVSSHINQSLTVFFFLLSYRTSESLSRTDQSQILRWCTNRSQWDILPHP